MCTSAAALDPQGPATGVQHITTQTHESLQLCKDFCSDYLQMLRQGQARETSAGVRREAQSAEASASSSAKQVHTALEVNRWTVCRYMA